MSELVHHTVTYTGVVDSYNWFSGFGFIKVINPGVGCHDELGVVFVHVSQVRTARYLAPVRKKLVTGETVEFELAPPRDPSKGERPQAICVRGRHGLPLMCEYGNIEFTDYTRPNRGASNRDEHPTAPASDSPAGAAATSE